MTEYTNASGFTMTVNDPNLAHVGETWMRIGREMEAAKRQWIDELRAQGVAAAHPDDGWVDREKNEVFLSYPDFNDGIEVGARIALGRPDTGDLMSRTRIVTVIGSRALRINPSMIYWQFTEPESPEASTQRSWWRFWAHD